MQQRPGLGPQAEAQLKFLGLNPQSTELKPQVMLEIRRCLNSGEAGRREPKACAPWAVAGPFMHQGQLALKETIAAFYWLGIILDT